MAYFPQEYTPELTEEFYKRMAKPIEEETARNIGLARSEALARGLEGDPFEAIAVSGARKAGTESLADLYAKLGWQGAGWGREERLGREGREWNAGESEKARAWQGAESEKQRAFRERLANLQYQWQRKLLRESQPDFWDYLGQGLGTAGSFGLGKLFGIW